MPAPPDPLPPGENRRRVGPGAIPPPCPSLWKARLQAAARATALALLMAPASATILAAAPRKPAERPPGREDLHRAEQEAAQAKDLAEAAARASREAREYEERLSAERAELGRRAVAAEEALDEAQSQLDAAQADLAAAEAALREQSARLAPLLPAMRRMSAWPAETLLALPVPPEEALRGALVLRGLGRRLSEEATAYRIAREQTGQALARAAARRENLAQARDRARAASQAVEASLSEARTARGQADHAEERAAQRAASLAARAGNLRGAIARLEREAAARAEREAKEKAAREEATRQAAQAAATAREDARRAARRNREDEEQVAALPSAPAIPRGRGRALPVAGRVISQFGAGGTTGQTWSTPPGARVVSPCSGQVAFADTFRSYGLLLIMDCGDGYHVVLSGLDRLDAGVGQKVSAGEAVGQMGRPSSGRPSLYVELRRRGQAVDPRPWLAGNGRTG
ncbi:peptidoglycan DD-metalloendopeptidase family protein [Roseomonas gilardii subsp. gilardii]|uniref:murein hydrolase activator EnvC family protein n=1 Tax=Roseomonas gilardii TaxID=257708 RepID=UPI001FF7175F|nr:peptidoglycan DD-metalloendopeptidase family protein [Roseomonas gilardii]UPG72778.1 peptidoglycan DD-metalloendopeptidase family protein [Roseomonas gilardii subsp. gilardii]